MPKTTAEKRQLIEGIYQERARKGGNTVSLAQSIRSFSYDALSGEKYLAELLQNADDAKSKSVSWIITPDHGHLILMHEGEVFSDQDVRAICDHASGKRAKVTDTEQIGNKGVGFKAVFTVAEAVYIFSGGYHFCFDEKHREWQDCVEEYPWQIIPIWTNPAELPGINSLLDLGKTCFVFKLRAEIRTAVATHLAKLTSRHLLFLRHVKQMSITLPGQSAQIRALAAPTSVIPNVTKVACGKNDWLVYQYQVDLPLALKGVLRTAHNIPAKYRSATSMPFQIAIFAEGDQLLSIKIGQKVFCYLPTDLDLGMNVLVNAEFLLDPSRMHLREGQAADAWNQWMLISLWQGLIQFLSLLAINSPAYAHHIFSVLTNPEKISWGNLERFKAACVEAFKAVLQTTPLVSDLSDNNVLTVGRVKLDWTSFIQYFGAQTERDVCAHPSMQNQQLIKELGATVFEIDDIISAAQTPLFRSMMYDPQQNRRFLECLKTLEERMKKEMLTKKIEDLLAGTALILSARKELKKSREVFFPEEALRYAIASDKFLDLLHANLYVDKALCAWLGRMGMNAITLARMINMANKAPTYSVRFVVHLVRSGAWEKLDASCQAALKTLRLKTRSTHPEAEQNFQEAPLCYLPSLYEPRLPSEGFTSRYDALLSDEYSAENVNLTDLKRFFLFMGVRQEINIKTLTLFVPVVNQFASFAQCVAFTRWAFATFFLGQKIDIQEKALSALHELQVFSTKQQRLKKESCYLADAYEPEMPLQQHAPDMHFLATDYMAADRVNTSAWRTFFARLGVHQKLVVTPHKNLHRDNSVARVDGADEYFSYLESQVKNLFPDVTRPYMDQHYVTFYLEMPCATSLYSASLFWQLLIRHWEDFAELLRRDVFYHTARSKEQVPSNVHVLVEKAVQAKYGADKKVEDFYPAVVQKILRHYADGYVFAEITERLTLEQAKLLGFKTRLPLEDCAVILRKIAAANKAHEEFSTIIFIYQQILTYIKEGHEDFSAVADVPLLTQAGSFVPASELYYLQNDFLDLKRHNAKIIQRPKTFSHEDFEKLCDAFSIRSITREEVKIKISKKVDSSLQTMLQEKWFYVLNIILDRKDLTEKQARSVEAAKYLQQFQERFALLTIKAAETVQCCYGTVVSEPIDLWIFETADQTESTVCHTEPLADIDPGDKQQLYRFLYEHFQLNDDIDEETFVSLMGMTAARLLRRYNQISSHWVALGDIDITLATQGVPTVPSPFLNNTQVASAASPMTLPNARNASPVIDDSGAATAEATAPTQLTLFGGQRQRKRSHSSLEASGPPATTEAKAVHSSPKRSFLGENLESRIAVGKKGELVVYHSLLKKHREKYGAEKIQENPDGYTIQTDDGTKTVRWLNKKAESWQPYDFEIIVTEGEQQKIRRLEVKATRSHEQKIEINYSVGEWQQLQKLDKNNKYKLYIVRGIDLGADFSNVSLTIMKQEELLLLEPQQYFRLSLTR